MNKHDELIARLNTTRLDKDNFPRMDSERWCPVGLAREAADLLQQYGDALVRLGGIDYQFLGIESPVHEWDTEELSARIEYAQTTVEVQDDPADYDICDEHETVFPRYGKCPRCDTVEGE